LNFEPTLARSHRESTRSHPVNKTAGKRITAAGAAGNASAGPLNTGRKEIPERTGYLDELPAHRPAADHIGFQRSVVPGYTIVR